jgi:glycine/D-amino acid oxidase-like deaminating enzyme
MHICVIGGGIAGSLLAWRLAQLPGVNVDLFTGRHRASDATEASGGGVRAYESEPHQRELALSSLLELLSSKVLREWSDYHRTGAAYLQWPELGLDTVLSEVDRRLHGSAELMSGSQLGTRGWAQIPAGSVAIVERLAGYVNPARLRRAVLDDLARHQRVRIIPKNADRLNEPHDKVVVATGAWTPGLLRRNGYDASDYRTKSIQYTLYRSGGSWRPPVFVDEISGLYGRPTTDGMLLGVPTEDWGAEPGEHACEAALEEKAARLVTARFPQLRLGTAIRRVRATDCYTDPALLRLRPVPGGSERLFTFTGGSGGSVKTALAASQLAARTLASG